MINDIEIIPSVQANDVKQRIEQALKRRAGIDPNAIRVSVPERYKVVLEGNVGSWDERYAVENAAWSAPGVKSVEDRMIGPFVYDEKRRRLNVLAPQRANSRFPAEVAPGTGSMACCKVDLDQRIAFEEDSGTLTVTVTFFPVLSALLPLYRAS